MRMSYSRSSSILDCEQAYYFSYERKLAPRHTPIPFITGSALHAGLAVLRTEESLKKAQDAVEAYYQKVVEEENAQVAFLPEELEGMKTEVLWGKMMLARFTKQFPAPEWVLLQPEVRGEVQLGDSHHTLVFIVDGLFQWRGQLWIGEYKSKGVVQTPWLKSFSMNKQVTCYVYGVSKLLKKDIAGAILWIFPKKPLDAKILVETPLRTPDQLVRIENEMIALGDRIEAAQKSGMWIRNEAMCNAPARKECIYRKLCLYGATEDAIGTYNIKKDKYEGQTFPSVSVLPR